MTSETVSFMIYLLNARLTKIFILYSGSPKRVVFGSSMKQEVWAGGMDV